MRSHDLTAKAVIRRRHCGCHGNDGPQCPVDVSMERGGLRLSTDGIDLWISSSSSFGLYGIATGRFDDTSLGILIQMTSMPPQSTTPISTSSPAPKAVATLIRIEINSQPGRRYKSIDNLVWDDVPGLAVITGLNGAGKTQLLEILAFKLTETRHPEQGALDGIDVKITGDAFGPESVAYLPSRWEMTPAVHLGISQMQQAKGQLWNEVRQQQTTTDIRTKSRIARIQKIVGNNGQDQHTFSQSLPDDYAFMLDDSDVVAGLAHVLVAYRLRFAEELERNFSRDEIAAKLGPAPWDVINEAFQVADFPYRVVSPTGTAIAGTYKLELENHLNRHRIQPGDLSSGEKMLLVLVLWLYKSQHQGSFPRLFLLDEPDAHLHPSLTRQFLSVIKEVLVERHGVRVILTTHSPSTVALAPPGSVFEMSRSQPRIQPSKSSAATVGLLTAGFVVVSAGSRLVLVEDESDVSFYECIRDVLSDYGPSRDPRAIKPVPSVVFLPASRGTGAAKVGGGSTVVTQWVDKFDQPPLNEIVRGVIDHDGSNAPTNRTRVLGRHSIENYLLDPFVVFCLLSSAGRAPAVAGLPISIGDEHLIRELPEETLVTLITAVRGCVEPLLANPSPADTLKKTVSFTNGKNVDYPAWMLDRRGHDLLPAFQAAFGGPGVVNPPRLEQAVRRLRLIPVELADIFDALQA